MPFARRSVTRCRISHHFLQGRFVDTFLERIASCCSSYMGSREDSVCIAKLSASHAIGGLARSEAKLAIAQFLHWHQYTHSALSATASTYTAVLR